MVDPIRMIVVGLGRGKSHIRTITSLPEQFELVGVVDLNNEILNKVLEEFSLPESLGFASYDDALEQSSCDGVVIATWARSHEPLVEQALMADKHVLAEKPFVLELEPAKRLLNLAESRGRKVVINQQWRYMPAQRTIRRLMRDKTYGEAQIAHFNGYKARGSEYPDSPYSQLWQMTVHEVDSIISMLNQPVVEVYGHAYKPPKTTWNRESTVTAEMTMRNGCRVILVSTSDSRTHGCEFRIECEKAAVVMRNTRCMGGEETVFIGEDPSVGLQPYPIDPELDRSTDAQVALSFSSWIRGGPEPETSGRNNLEVLGVLDALIKAGASGEAQKVG